jgi:hypothetical protein
MALKTFTAKANVGAGNDPLAAVATPLGDAGAVALVTAAGALVDDANPSQVQDGAAGSLLSRILNLLMSPMGFDRAQSRQRVTGIIESGALTSLGTVTTVSTVTTVGAVTNLSTIDTVQGRLLPLNQNASAWAATVRSCIS